MMISADYAVRDSLVSGKAHVVRDEAHGRVADDDQC